MNSKTGGPNAANDWSRTRPRLLSHVGRWGRARRWLPDDARNILDVGCGVGYGTAAIGAGRTQSRSMVGVEYDPANVRLAARCLPWLPIARADAGKLPFLDGTFDAVVTLDVVEHLPDAVAALAEIRRVLKPGGTLILSVPHQGLLARCDSNNVYAALCKRFRWFLPLESYEASAGGVHRHFSLGELQDLLGAGFTVERTAGTGLGLAELLNVAIATVFKGILRWRGAYMALRNLYYMAYLVEDFLPAGTLGYTMTVRASARPRPTPSRAIDSRTAQVS